jgi:hypothetical protein
MAGPAKDIGSRSGETILQRCCDWMERSDLNGLDRGETARVASELRMTL